MATVNFTLNFEWLTDHIRNLWAEHSFQQAFDTLDACGVMGDLANQVILGGKKLVQDPYGVEGVDGMIIEDNWLPDLKQCHLSAYPNPYSIEEYVAEREAEKLDKEVVLLERLIRDWNRHIRRYDGYSLVDVLEGIKYQFKNISKKAFMMLDYSKDELVNNYYYPIDEPNMSELDRIIERAEEALNSDVEVIEDKSLDSKCGLISPKGKFYACGWMQHDALANELGFSKEQLEDDGWIVISEKAITRNTVFTAEYKKVKQQALNTLFDWADKHDAMVALTDFLDMIDNEPVKVEEIYKKT